MAKGYKVLPDNDDIDAILQNIVKDYKDSGRSELDSVSKIFNKLFRAHYKEHGWGRYEPAEMGRMSELVPLRMLGSIAAGEPIEAYEDRQVLAFVPRSKMARTGEHFVLRVRGDSMRDEDMDDGDVIVVRKQSDGEEGDKVVAVVNRAGATVKKLRRDGDKIMLQPANPDHKPILVDRGDVEIKGIVTGCIKAASGVDFRDGDE